MPGVINQAGPDELFVGTTVASGTTATTPYSVNGMRNSSNHLTVDGADNVDRGSNLTLGYYPSIDATSQFTVQRSTYTADTGRAGGAQINVVTKSGTRTRSMPTSANRTPVRWNDFGGTFGDGASSTTRRSIPPCPPPACCKATSSSRCASPRSAPEPVEPACSSMPNGCTTHTNSPGRAYVFHALNTLRPTLINDFGFNYTYSAIVSTPEGLTAKSNNPDINPQEPFTNSQGVVAFTNAGAPTGTSTFQQSWANFLLGNVSTFTMPSTDITPDVRTWQHEAYAQDDFKLNPRLTLYVGVRWSYFGQPTDAKGRMDNFDPALYNPANAPAVNPANGNFVTPIPYNNPPTNGIIIGGRNSPFGGKIANDTYKKFAPRIGVACVTISNASFSNVTSGTVGVSAAPLGLRATQLPARVPYYQQWNPTVEHRFREPTC